MSKYIDIIYSLTSFTVMAIIFLIILAIVLNITSKKFDIEKLRLYGIFLNMTKNNIIAFSLVTLAYLILVWLLIDLNISYVYIASLLSLTIIADLYARNYPHGFLNILNMIFSLIAIYFVSYLSSQIQADNNMFLSLIMIFVVIFLFLYFTYMTFRNLNHLVNLEKNRIVKNKRGNNNEN